MTEQLSTPPEPGEDSEEQWLDDPGSTTETTESSPREPNEAAERSSSPVMSIEPDSSTSTERVTTSLDDGSPGWHMESPESQDSSSDSRSKPNSGVLTRVSLGSALLAIDALNERLDQVDEQQTEEDSGVRPAESVLVPEDEWEERFGRAPGLAARHLALGVAINTRTKVNRGLTFLNNVGNVTVRALEIVFEPITSSRLFRPVKKRFNTAANRGEGQVNFWMNLGRTEDVRSRQIAESTLTQVVEESMDEIVDDQRVQEFVQEMLAAQSLGIIDEAIEEIRERGVSSDIFFEQPFRRLFRRSPRRTIPGPQFDRRIVRPMSKRSMPIDQGSLLGYYAGFTSRMLALAIDIGLVVVFMAMTGWIFQTVGGFLRETSLVDTLSLTEQMLSTIGAVFAGLNAATVVIAYAFIFWILTGQTPGMMLLGLRVVSTDGGHVTFWRAVLRLLGYIISIMLLFIGFFWVLADDRRQGWHDKLAKTYVVYSWDAHPDETFLTSFM
jgi:uncharacterized RDD family membrane protein YckC